MKRRIFAGVLFAMGVLLLVGMELERWWAPVVHPFIFDAHGNFYHGGMAEVVSRGLSWAKDLVRDAWFWSPMLMIAGCALYLVRPTGVAWCDARRYALMMLAAGVICTGMVVVLTAPFFTLARGTEVRPMGWAAALFMMEIVSLGVGLACAVASFFKDGRRWLVLPGLLLCLAPYPVGVGLFYLTGLTLAD